MDITTFRELVRSCVGDQPEMLYKHARALVTPVSPVWKSLIQQSVLKWTSRDSPIFAGNTPMYSKELLDGRNDIFFVHSTNDTCLESVDSPIMDPRFQGMMLAISSLLPFDSIPCSWTYSDAHQIVRNLLKNHPIEQLIDDVELIVVFDGVCNMPWVHLRNIGIKWMRVWYSVRKIQRAYRESLKYKRMKMIQMVIVPQ